MFHERHPWHLRPFPERALPVGFSWTTLFFGFFPALLRGYWVAAIVIGRTWGLSGLVFAFISNRWHLTHVIGGGFKVASPSHDVTYLGQRMRVALPTAEASALPA